MVTSVRRAFLALVLVSGSAGALDLYDGLPPEQAAFLFSHNQMRAAHCVPPLSWSTELAARAQTWADKLAAEGCAFEHSNGLYGENLARGTAGVDDDPRDIVRLWYDEVASYDFRRGGSLATGHFTQLVWMGTRRLGCGTSTCRGKRLWVCNYDPAGNYLGEYGANVLPRSCRQMAAGVNSAP